MTQPEEQAARLLTQLKLIRVEAKEAGIRTDRERAIGAMEELIQGARRQRLYRRAFTAVVIGSSAMAAGYCAVWAFGKAQPWLWRESKIAAPRIVAASGRVHVSSRSGLERPGALGGTVEASETITSEPSGTAALVLASDARVQLSPASQLVIAEASRQHTLALKHGTVTLDVPKLSANQHLAVTTAHARIVVVGTRFWVSVMPARDALGARTCVGVAQGTVRIVTAQGQTPLSAGNQWSSDGLACAAAPPLSTATSEASSQFPHSNSLQTPKTTAHSVASAPRGEPAPLEDTGPAQQQRHTESSEARSAVDVASTAMPPVDVEQSSLDAQNRLFATAMAAQRAGQATRAAELLSELLTRYPHSPLADQASRELDKARLLNSSNRRK